MSNIITTYIDLLRHGEPEGGEVFRGHIDPVLTNLGWQQATKQTEQHDDWELIVSSPLRRCAEFAEQLSQKKQLNFHLDEGFKEIFYGDWEGMPTTEAFKHHPEIAQQMWQDPMGFCAPNGESVQAFEYRILSAWQQLLADHQGKKVLLVCHGGVIRILLKNLLSMLPEAMNRFAVPYASRTRLRIDDDQKHQQQYISLQWHATHINVDD